MKNRSLFAIDIDGTLLRSDYSIGAFTKSVLKDLVNEGHVVLLASGRPIRSLLPYYKSLGLKGPIVCYNGAYVGQPENPLCFPTIDPCISKEEIVSIVSPLQDRLDFFMGENHQKMTASQENPFLDKYFPTTSLTRTISPTLSDLPEKMKIFIFSAKEEVADQIEARLANYPQYSFHRWRNVPYYEIVLTGASKGDALRAVAAYYGIHKEDTYAFGDSENDLSLLEEAGHPFAMKGCKSVLLPKLFPLTEKGNDQDGVAFEITKLFA